MDCCCCCRCRPPAEQRDDCAMWTEGPTAEGGLRRGWGARGLGRLGGEGAGGVRTLRACTKCRLRCISSSSKVMCAGSASSSSTEGEGEGEGEVLREAECGGGRRGDPAVPIVVGRRQAHPGPGPAGQQTQSSNNQDAETGRDGKRTKTEPAEHNRQTEQRRREGEWRGLKERRRRFQSGRSQE